MMILVDHPTLLRSTFFRSLSAINSPFCAKADHFALKLIHKYQASVQKM
ncbi:hypothetical protein PAGA_a3924 [Pseudoalteromonas agarivorans DSM 14585]|uniref:Uncharacterized protein n=1 Tax=Pseudoalteromonas agarivorans DSM 14585 TaxID=1312369 RepID=A0ACA8E0Z3_9GAMM|nr:hypothetical protein PAGA_a3924 [Pseudoalteromonas agarivorans DSM 14585]